MNKKPISVAGIFALVLALCSVMFLMSGCGKDVKIKINDLGVTTEADANTGMTISEILKNAGISLGEKDKSEPASDKKLEDTTEITVKRFAKVTVKNGEEEKTVELVGATVEDAVKEAGFDITDCVIVDAKKEDFLKDGMVITLAGSMDVSLTVEGKTSSCKTHAETVKDFLVEQKITLGKDDVVIPKLEDKVTAGMKIVVNRVEYKEVVEKEVVDFEVEEVQSSSLNAGESMVTQEGSEGEKEVTYKVKYVNGKAESKEKVSEKVTKEPVNKVVSIGTATTQQADDSNTQSNKTEQGGKQVVSKQAVYDCDGSGHGYYVITYSDGTVDYEEF